MVRSKGVVGGTAPVNSDQPYFEFQVEKQVAQIPGQPGNLRYPDMLRSANVEGEVLAQFVVDTTGRYEAGTFKVLKSTSRAVHRCGEECAADACASIRPRSADER